MLTSVMVELDTVTDAKSGQRVKKPKRILNHDEMTETEGMDVEEIPKFFVEFWDELVDEYGHDVIDMLAYDEGITGAVHEQDPEHYYWFHTDEGGDPWIVGFLVQKFLQKFRPDDCWGLTWACTCSKPRLDEFHGGGMFVSASEIKFFDSYSWLLDQTTKHREEHQSKGADTQEKAEG